MIFDRLARMTGFDKPNDAGASSRMYGLPPAGVPVDEQTALRFGAVWSCVKVISETVMTLPWGVLLRNGANREPAPDHPVDALLRRRPNLEMPANAFKSTITAHALLQGNGYAEIERNGRGDPLALWLLDPRRTDLDRDKSGQLYYKSRDEHGRVTEIPPEDVFHLRGPSYDGLVGMSVVGLARDSISAAMAVERFGATFFGNGAIPGGLISHEAESKLKGFDTAGLQNFYESWEKRLKGSGRAHKVMYIDPGLKYQAMSIDPDDAQFIATRKLSIPEICRWFRVPPHKVMDLEKATFTNIEHQSREFLEDAIMPWLVRFEEEANSKLLAGDYYSKFSVQAALRGDSQARGDYFQKLLDRGVLTINDVRSLEDMNGIGPLGDMRMVPLNMTTLERLGEPTP